MLSKCWFQQPTRTPASRTPEMGGARRSTSPGPMAPLCRYPSIHLSTCSKLHPKLGLSLQIAKFFQTKHRWSTTLTMMFLVPRTLQGALPRTYNRRNFSGPGGPPPMGGMGGPPPMGGRGPGPFGGRGGGRVSSLPLSTTLGCLQHCFFKRTTQTRGGDVTAKTSPLVVLGGEGKNNRCVFVCFFHL